METQKLRTREEVLADFARKGISIRSWAKKNGLSHGCVRGVLSGRLTGRIGQSHKVAVLLGMKEGEIVEEIGHG
ncbi:MAG TPA: DNA-binding protein [Accumulibacter sp.]|nr:DNA-binding protein [Accumulibacter sp.]